MQIFITGHKIRMRVLMFIFYPGFYDRFFSSHTKSNISRLVLFIYMKYLYYNLSVSQIILVQFYFIYVKYFISYFECK